MSSMQMESQNIDLTMCVFESMCVDCTLFPSNVEILPDHIISVCPSNLFILALAVCLYLSSCGRNYIFWQTTRAASQSHFWLIIKQLNALTSIFFPAFCDSIQFVDFWMVMYAKIRVYVCKKDVCAQAMRKISWILNYFERQRICC